MVPILRSILVGSLLAFGSAGLASAQSLLIDNSDPGFSTTGSGWDVSALPGFHGTDSLSNRIGTGADEARWEATLPESGYYDVHAWWVGSANHSPVVPLTIKHAEGETTLRINQQVGSGRWNHLGRYRFNTSTPATVKLADVGNPAALNSLVSADAIRFTYAGADAEPNHPQVEIGGFSPCHNCLGSILPGVFEDDPETRYFIVSDMPEKFGYPTAGPITRSDGILYHTKVLLPSFGTNYPPAPFHEQQVNGFTTIDDDFEIFIFNIAQPGDTSKPRRIVVHVMNNGAEPVVLNPSQVIITDGTIGTVHQMESDLGRRVYAGEWDTQDITNLPDSMTIAPGTGAVIALSKKFAVAGNSRFKSQNLNCFGIVRGLVQGTNPDLTVAIVAIDETSADAAPNLAEINSKTQKLIAANIGAPELEDFQFDHTPPNCTLRRSTGVFPHKVWRGALGVDVNTLSSDATYQMGLDSVRTPDCPELSQTVPALLAPKWLRQESIGNYMVDYRVQVTLSNSGSEARPFDLQFGKANADIGLVYQMAISEAGPVSDSSVDASEPKTSWAGKNQSSPFKSLLPAPITLQPGEVRHVGLRFQILGNSSTPFQFRIPGTE